MSGLLAKVSNTLECAICSEMMHVPFLTSCGHSFCYKCLSMWFGNRLNCPTCRKDMEHPPTLNVQLRTISWNVSELLIDVGGDEGKALKEAREEADAEYRQEIRALFGNAFTATALTVIDNSDGVPRCGNCHWEAHGSVCLHCGTRFRVPRDDDYYDSDNGEAYDEDEQEHEELDFYDSDDSFIDRRAIIENGILSSDESEGEWQGFSTEPVYVDDEADEDERANREENEDHDVVDVDSDASSDLQEVEDLDQALDRFNNDIGDDDDEDEDMHDYSIDEVLVGRRRRGGGRRTIGMDEEDEDDE